MTQCRRSSWHARSEHDPTVISACRIRAGSRERNARQGFRSDRPINYARDQMIMNHGLPTARSRTRSTRCNPHDPGSFRRLVRPRNRRARAAPVGDRRGANEARSGCERRGRSVRCRRGPCGPHRNWNGSSTKHMSRPSSRRSSRSGAKDSPRPRCGQARESGIQGIYILIAKKEQEIELLVSKKYLAVLTQSAPGGDPRGLHRGLQEARLQRRAQARSRRDRRRALTASGATRSLPERTPPPPCWDSPAPAQRRTERLALGVPQPGSARAGRSAGHHRRRTGQGNGDEAQGQHRGGR